MQPKEKSQKTEMNIDRQVTRARNALRYSQQELADDAGVDITVIREIESSARDVMVGELNKIAQTMELPLEFFFGDDHLDLVTNERCVVQHDDCPYCGEDLDEICFDVWVHWQMWNRAEERCPNPECLRLFVMTKKPDGCRTNGYSEDYFKVHPVNVSPL